MGQFNVKQRFWSAVTYHRFSDLLQVMLQMKAVTGHRTPKSLLTKRVRML
jgi:hypothetical protein